VVNVSAEFHNLHIHQGNFRPARAADPGAPPDLANALHDPDGQFARQLGRLLGIGGSWHDSLPVAARAAGGEAARTFLYLPFAAAEQEGVYPVHCHILEHEDKGMMAVVQVLPPAPQPGARLTDAQLLALLAAPDGALPAMCPPVAR
jgi:FtsP/CotA-like multicopper oxidase with cupredoxin domain